MLDLDRRSRQIGEVVVEANRGVVGAPASAKDWEILRQWARQLGRKLADYQRIRATPADGKAIAKLMDQVGVEAMWLYTHAVASGYDPALLAPLRTATDDPQAAKSMCRHIEACPPPSPPGQRENEGPSRGFATIEVNSGWIEVDERVRAVMNECTSF